MDETLNPGIRETVAWVRSLGFETCDSGDGQTHEHACDRDHAYVVISVADPAMMVTFAKELHRILRIRGIAPGPVGGRLPCIQASFDPENGLAFIDLMNLDDALLRGAS